MVLQSQTSLERIEQSFNEVAREFLQTELVDNGRSIQNRGRLHGGMKMQMSNMESRHEAAIRTLVGMVGALSIRVKKLENPYAAQVVEMTETSATVTGPGTTEAQAALLDAPEKPAPETT